MGVTGDRPGSTKASYPQGDPLEALVREARGGSEEAFGRLVEACRRYLTLIARREMPADLQAKFSASDVVQDTLIKAKRGFAALRVALLQLAPEARPRESEILRQLLGEGAVVMQPRSEFHAKLMAFANLLRLRLRGTRYRERPEQQVSSEELSRLDTCWSATILINTDQLRGLPFATRFPLLALQVGEPYRVSLALAQLGVLRSYSGDWEEALEIFGRAESLARRLHRPHALGYLRMTMGFAHAMRGEWRAALRCSDEAEAILREQSGAVQLERSGRSRPSWPRCSFSVKSRRSLAECLS